ncbi:ribosome hibernation promotion factor [Devosia sp.]|uniref:ribosome hibernation promotion factor n=1 Tax=Devosia sp. TaxID=1871048 RepID=UPI002EE44C7D
MPLRVSGKNMDVGDALRAKATGHFDTVVRKYFDGAYEGRLTMAPEGSGFSAQCTLHLDSGAVLLSTAHGGDALSAYEMMAATIEKRLRRYNSRLKQRRRPAPGDTLPASRAGLAALPEDDDEPMAGSAPPVVAEPASGLREMSVGEAVMELDLAVADVVLFRHAGHGGLNVVYRRADGNIGWIDPALRAN